MSPLPIGYHEEGVASWYGLPFHGRQAADGEIYDMETLVAAHRTMPFNTWVRVTNVSNGKRVDVRIIDRGPFIEGRLIDLSKAAARQIDLLGPGTGKVRLEVIAHIESRVSEEHLEKAPVVPATVAPPPEAAVPDQYTVQVGAFSVYDNAERLCHEYALRFGSAELVLQRGLYRVQLGRTSMENANRIASDLAAENKSVFVVRVDAALTNEIRNDPTQTVPIQ